MNIFTKKYTYGGYEIEIYLNQLFDNFTYKVKNLNDEIVLISNRMFEEESHAYLNACLDINEEFSL